MPYATFRGRGNNSKLNSSRCGNFFALDSLIYNRELFVQFCWQ